MKVAIESRVMGPGVLCLKDLFASSRIFFAWDRFLSGLVSGFFLGLGLVVGLSGPFGWACFPGCVSVKEGVSGERRLVSGIRA